VALAALERSLELYPAAGDGAKPKERAKVLEKLMAMAKASGVRSLLARGALARAGAREVLPLLKTDAKSDNGQARKAAGYSLAALGEYGRAAVLAVDQDERVRTGVACALLRKVD
jgi:HEAT repeat protein